MFKASVHPSYADDFSYYLLLLPFLWAPDLDTSPAYLTPLIVMSQRPLNLLCPSSDPNKTKQTRDFCSASSLSRWHHYPSNCTNLDIQEPSCRFSPSIPTSSASLLKSLLSPSISLYLHWQFLLLQQSLYMFPLHPLLFFSDLFSCCSRRYFSQDANLMLFSLALIFPTSLRETAAWPQGCAWTSPDSSHPSPVSLYNFRPPHPHWPSFSFQNVPYSCHRAFPRAVSFFFSPG